MSKKPTALRCRLCGAPVAGPGMYRCPRHQARFEEMQYWNPGLEDWGPSEPWVPKSLRKKKKETG